MRITTDQIRSYLNSVRGPAKNYARLREQFINSIAQAGTQIATRPTPQHLQSADEVSKAAALMFDSVASSGLSHLASNLVEDENKKSLEALSATELIDLAQTFLSISHGFHDLFDIKGNAHYRILGGVHSSITGHMLELAQEK